MFSSLLGTPAAAVAAAPTSLVRLDDVKSKAKLNMVTVRRTGKSANRRGRRSHAVGVVPELQTSVIINHKYRFICTTGETVNVSLLDMFGALGGICTVANTTLTTWTGSLRLRKIEIYESAQSVSTVSSMVIWYSNSNSNLADKLTLNSSIPYDLPSKNVAVPPKDSLASFWWNSSASSSLAFFAINCAVGSVIDVTIESTLGNQAGGYQPTIATGTLGGDYYLALDGPSSNKIVPVGLPTTH